MKLNLNRCNPNPRIFTIYLPGIPQTYEYIPIHSSKKGYNPQVHHIEINKEHIREQIQEQIHANIIIAFTFFLPPPNYLAPHSYHKLTNQPHTTPPSITDLIKFYLIVVENTLCSPCYISAITARKVYATNTHEPHTEMLITCQ